MAQIFPLILGSTPKPKGRAILTNLLAGRSALVDVSAELVTMPSEFRTSESDLSPDVEGMASCSISTLADLATAGLVSDSVLAVAFGISPIWVNEETTDCVMAGIMPGNMAVTMDWTWLKRPSVLTD